MACLGGERKRRRAETYNLTEPAVQRQRVGDTLSQPVDETTTSGLTFTLKDFQTVGQAWEAYEAIAAIPLRRWQGDLKQRTKYSTAFGRFRDGLAAQIKARGVEALEKERLTDPRFKPLHRKSALQRQANFYLAK